MAKVNNMTYYNEGFGIKVPLSQFSSEEKYRSYYASCQFRYAKREEKYSLTMWLNRDDFNGRYCITSREIDTQYISGTRDTIRENVCRVVRQMVESGYFESYIGMFEYDMMCFERGYELLDQDGSDQ